MAYEPKPPVIPTDRTCPFDPDPEYRRLREEEPISPVRFDIAPGRDDGWLVGGLEQGSVVRIEGPYVISGGWWMSPEIAEETHREYHYAETRRGDCLWLYFDRRRRRWFQHGAVE